MIPRNKPVLQRLLEQTKKEAFASFFCLEKIFEHHQGEISSNEINSKLLKGHLLDSVYAVAFLCPVKGMFKFREHIF